MAVNTLSSTMMDKSPLENISSILRDFSDLSEENRIYLCQPQSLRFIVNLLLQEKTTIVENASVILKNISKHLAVNESLRLILSQNGCYEKLLQLLQSPNMNLVSNACKILKALSEGCPSDRKTLVDLGAVALLSECVTSRHEDIYMASSEALQNLLTCRNTFSFDSFNSESDGQRIHYANPVNHTGVLEGSAGQPIISSNRGTEFEEFMRSSSPELPTHYCTEGTPDSCSVRNYPTRSAYPNSYLQNTNSNQKLLTETVRAIFDAEEVPVDYSTKYSAECFSGGSSVSSLSRLSLRSLEKPLLSAQLSKLKEGLGSDFDLVRLLCAQETPSAILPNLSTQITSTPSRPLSQNNVNEAQGETLCDDSPKNTSTSSSSSSFSCSSEESNVDESVDLCLELGMPKSNNSKVFVCPERKSCEGSSLDQTTAVHQDKNTPSMLEKSCFSEDGEENVTVIYKEIDNKQEDLEVFGDLVGNFYEKTFSEKEGRRFRFKNSIKPTKLFSFSLRKKKNHQKSNPKVVDETKTNKRT